MRCWLRLQFQLQLRTSDHFNQSVSDILVIPIAFDLSHIPLPPINVRIPIKLAPGTYGRCSDLHLSCVAFLKYLASSFK